MAKSDRGETVLDFSGVRPFEPLNSSVRYLCTVTDNRRDQGPSGDMSAVEFTIEEPEEVQVERWEEDSDAEGGLRKGDGLEDRVTKAKGRKLFRNYSHVPQALPFLYEFIKAVDPDAELNEAFKYKESDYIGLQCSVSIQNEAFDEQVRPRVKKVYPVNK